MGVYNELLRIFRCLLHFMKWWSAERNFLSKGMHIATRPPHPLRSPNTHTHSLSPVYIFQTYEYVCRCVNLEILILCGSPEKFSPPQHELRLVCPWGI